MGENLSAALQAVGARHRHSVVLLNDTVATLLAGRNAVPGRRFDDFVGIVCGTGFNASYVEQNRNIRKLTDIDPAGSQIINTESGSFEPTPTGDVDVAFDATTATPAKYSHEKMISGAYLGPLGLFTAKQAAAAGCFSPAAAIRLESLEDLSTRELNDFLLRPDSADNPLGSACAGLPAEDRSDLVRLVDTLIERAALLVAVTIASVVLKTGKGRDPAVPVRVTVDGTTYWQLASFHQRVQAHMKKLLSGERERSWEIGSVSDAPLLGAAIAALTN